jgi:hypothetical protein
VCVCVCVPRSHAATAGSQWLLRWPVDARGVPQRDPCTDGFEGVECDPSGNVIAMFVHCLPYVCGLIAVPVPPILSRRRWHAHGVCLPSHSSLHNNHLSGTIPPSFGNFLPALQRVYVLYRCTVPVACAPCTYSGVPLQVDGVLWYCHGSNLAGNFLVGDIPQSFGAITTLQQL